MSVTDDDVSEVIHPINCSMMKLVSAIRVFFVALEWS